MFAKLKSIFTGRPDAAAAPQSDLPLATAALLVEAARADEDYTDKERKLISAALTARFELSPADGQALLARAEAAQADANDLHQFTRYAKQQTTEEKSALVEAMWRIVLSDAVRDPHEDALIRRVCGLIYLSDIESAKARQRAEASSANP